jgi:hypothetical protein
MDQAVHPFPAAAGPPGTEAVSLRDFFAAAALTGLCAGPHHLAHLSNPERREGEAKMAFAIADAMLLARAWRP